MSGTIVVTGGAGFIGSAAVRRLIETTSKHVVNVDALTYASSLESISTVSTSDRYAFEKVNILDGPAVAEVLRKYRPTGLVHLAAESHVDRSIDGPRPFIETNIVGTYTLLEESRRYFEELSIDARRTFRIVHVSTDEVFGSLGAAGKFSESTPYDPSSPYSASKASADHLARAWYRTFGLPVIVTNCSNNFGPYQYPEKLVPVVIMRLLAGESVPVYGTGLNVRDWLYVDDHAQALLTVLERGEPGCTYNVGADNERTNIDLVEEICAIMDEIRPNPSGRRHASAIRFVEDRPGHDQRYAIDASRIRRELGWKPEYDHHIALRKTVEWYVANQDWCQARLGNGRGVERIGLGRPWDVD